MSASHISKFKKSYKQKIRIKSVARTLQEPVFGTFALRAKESSRLAECHFESLRRTFRRHLKKSGFIWFSGNPNTPVSGKPTNIRMGKGKGAVAFWAQVAPSGSFLVEGSGPSRDLLVKVIDVVRRKVPSRVGINWVRTKLHK